MKLLSTAILFHLLPHELHAACQFESPRVGEALYGLNEGGCYFCESELSVPLVDSELEKVCRQMCTADPNCLSFEYAKPPIFPFYSLVGLQPFNCCVQRRVVTSDSELWVNGWQDMTNCGNEILCWNHVDKSTNQVTGSCQITEPSPLCATVVIEPSEEPYSSDEVASQIEWIQNGCSDSDEEVDALLVTARAQCEALISSGGRSHGSQKLRSGFISILTVVVIYTLVCCGICYC